MLASIGVGKHNDAARSHSINEVIPITNSMNNVGFVTHNGSRLGAANRAC